MSLVSRCFSWAPLESGPAMRFCIQKSQLKKRFQGSEGSLGRVQWQIKEQRVVYISSAWEFQSIKYALLTENKESELPCAFCLQMFPGHFQGECIFQGTLSPPIYRQKKKKKKRCQQSKGSPLLAVANRNTQKLGRGREGYIKTVCKRCTPKGYEWSINIVHHSQVLLSHVQR